MEKSGTENLQPLNSKGGGLLWCADSATVSTMSRGSFPLLTLVLAAALLAHIFVATSVDLRHTRDAIPAAPSRVLADQPIQQDLRVRHEDGAESYLKYHAKYLHNNILLANHQEFGVESVHCQMHGSQQLLGTATIQFASLEHLNWAKDATLITGNEQWNCLAESTLQQQPFYFRVVRVRSVEQSTLQVTFEVTKAQMTDFFEHLQMTFHHMPPAMAARRNKETDDQTVTDRTLAWEGEIDQTVPLIDWNYNSYSGEAKHPISIYSDHGISVTCTNCYSHTDVEVYVDVNFNWDFKLESVEYYFGIEHETNLDVEATFTTAYQFSTEVELASFPLPRFTFDVDAVPVVITSNFDIYAGFHMEAEAETSISTGYDFHFSGRKGGLWTRLSGVWVPIDQASFTHHAHQPTFSASVSAQLDPYIRMALPAVFEGIFDVTLDMVPTLMLNAQWNKDGFPPSFLYTGPGCSDPYNFRWFLDWEFQSYATVQFSVHLFKWHWSSPAYTYHFPTFGPYPLANGCKELRTALITPAAATTAEMMRHCDNCLTSDVRELHSYGDFGGFDSCGSLAANGGVICAADAIYQSQIVFTAPQAGHYQFAVIDASFDAVIEVRSSWHGSLMQCISTDTDPTGVRTDIHLAEGQQIRLAIAGASGSCGTFSLSVSASDELLIFVSEANGQDTQAGSYREPVKTIAHAVDLIVAAWASSKQTTASITLFPGIYPYAGNGSSMAIPSHLPLVMASLFPVSAATVIQTQHLLEQSSQEQQKQALSQSMTGTALDTKITSTHGSLGDQSNAPARFLSLGEDGNVRLNGLWLEQARGTSGALIHAATHATLTLDNCVVSDNVASNAGGAIYSLGGQVTLRHCHFQNNSASRGGSLFLEGGATLSVRDVTFSHNRAVEGDGEGDGKGGALALSATSRVEMVDSHLSANSAKEGGALWAADLAAPMRMERLLFTGNSASNAGGAVFIQGDPSTPSNPPSTIQHAIQLSRFHQQEATTDGSCLVLKGAAVNMSMSSVTMTDNEGSAIVVSDSAQLTVVASRLTGTAGTEPVIRCTNARFQWDEGTDIAGSESSNIQCSNCGDSCVSCAACDICSRCTATGCDANYGQRVCQQAFPTYEAKCSLETGDCLCFANNTACGLYIPAAHTNPVQQPICQEKDAACAYTTVSGGTTIETSMFSANAEANVSSGSRIRLTIPPASLTADTLLSARPIWQAAELAQVQFETISPVFSIEPHYLQLNTPATITIDFSPCRQVSPGKSLVVVHWKDDETASYDVLPSSVVLWKGCSITFAVSSFSRYAIVDEDVLPTVNHAASSSASESGILHNLPHFVAQNTTHILVVVLFSFLLGILALLAVLAMLIVVVSVAIQRKKDRLGANLKGKQNTNALEETMKTVLLSEIAYDE